MSTRIAVANRIVIAIAIEIQSIDGFGVQVGGVIRRDKSAPIGGIVPGVAIIQTGVIRTIIAASIKKGAFAHATSVYLF